MAITPKEEGLETVQVPLSAIGEVAEGDTVTMTVVSVDAETGVANLAPVESSEPVAEESATEKMAGEFDQAPVEPGM